MKKPVLNNRLKDWFFLGFVVPAVALVIGVTIWTNASSHVTHYRALKDPGGYDRCPYCNTLFPHKKMYKYRGKWICDTCWAQYNLYIDDRDVK